MRLPEGEKEGICSLCECSADGTEFCKENLLLCFKPEGCIETEMKPDHCRTEVDQDSHCSSRMFSDPCGLATENKI